MPRYSFRRAGLSLIESAIVLGIVGLVIGGIWIAAVQVYEQQKANRVVEFLIQTATGIQNLYKGMPWDVPADSNIDVTTTMIQAGIVPRDFVRGLYLTTPYGSVTNWGNQIYRSNWSGVGEQIGIAIDGREGGYSVGATQQDCNRLIRTAATHMRNRLLFDRVQIVQNDAAHIGYVAPINPASVNCPPDFDLLIFWFQRQ